MLSWWGNAVQMSFEDKTFYPICHVSKWESYGKMKHTGDNLKVKMKRRNWDNQLLMSEGSVKVHRLAFSHNHWKAERKCSHIHDRHHTGVVDRWILHSILLRKMYFPWCNGITWTLRWQLLSHTELARPMWFCARKYSKVFIYFS